MIRHRYYYVFTLFLLLSSQFGCKSSTAPESGTNGASGTITFGDPFDVDMTTLGSNTSKVLFAGFDPAWTPSGQIIYAVTRGTSSDGNNQILVSNSDGTNTSFLLNFQEWLTTVDEHPHMSPDGKYISFNYFSEGGTFSPYYGTWIYTRSGTPVIRVDSMWDASWAPDGSFVVAGTVNANGFFTSDVTLYAPGLYRVDNQFKTITPIGSGLTRPKLPSVSPNGKTVAFEMNSHIWTINMDGTGLKQVTSGANEETYSAWSPDGNSIAVESLGTIGFTSGTRLAIVSANSNTALSDAYTGWVKDNSAQLGYLNPTRSISWR